MLTDEPTGYCFLTPTKDHLFNGKDCCVTATGKFFATPSEIDKLHVFLKSAERKFQRRHQRKQMFWARWKSRKPILRRQKQPVEGEQRQRRDDKKIRERVKSTKLAKLTKTKKLFLHSLSFATSAWNHGSCYFKVCPNVFQLDPARLEVRGPITSKPAWS